MRLVLRVRRLPRRCGGRPGPPRRCPHRPARRAFHRPTARPSELLISGDLPRHQSGSIPPHAQPWHRTSHSLLSIAKNRAYSLNSARRVPPAQIGDGQRRFSRAGCEEEGGAHGVGCGQAASVPMACSGCEAVVAGREPVVPRWPAVLGRDRAGGSQIPLRRSRVSSACWRSPETARIRGSSARGLGAASGPPTEPVATRTSLLPDRQPHVCKG